jgi:aromatic ring-cleaving dioxygenase
MFSCRIGRSFGYGERAMSNPFSLAQAAPPADDRLIKHFHAHVYYDAATTREVAARLREGVGARFQLGRWHDVLVGPHTQSMYQIEFAPELLSAFLPWLMLNRDDLSILLHPGTGDDYADHTAHAAWLGPVLPPLHSQEGVESGRIGASDQ